MKIFYLQLQSNRHICPHTSIVDEIFLSTIVDENLFIFKNVEVKIVEVKIVEVKIVEDKIVEVKIVKVKIFEVKIVEVQF